MNEIIGACQTVLWDESRIPAIVGGDSEWRDFWGNCEDRYDIRGLYARDTFALSSIKK